MRDNRNPQNRSYDRRQEEQPIRFDSRIITQGGEILVETADQLGLKMKNGGLTTSQIRNIYGAVKKMQMKGQLDSHKLLMLKPKLAYTAKRADNNGARLLKDVLTQAIDQVGNDQEKFNRFVDFFEAILAYHQFHGGN